MNQQNANTLSPKDRSWEEVVKKYNHPSLRKSIWQICNSFIPYILMWFLMYKSLQYSYAITLLLALVASGFLIRLFIIFHDCGHGSFFKSTKANNIVGSICGFFTTTPYRKWHHHHSIHHATSANLDKRGIGDIWTLTKEEYLNLSKFDRHKYRIYRNPLMMFTFGPILVLLIQNRVTNKIMNKADRINVYITNIAMLLLIIGMIMLIGLKAYLLIQIPVILFSHIIGIWLFLIQHNFEDMSWDRNTEWDYKTAAVKGSSFLNFSPILQWFTGNIGFHHVHHLGTRIPNYNLARCHYESEIFKDVKPISLFSTFKFLRLHLWDEENRQMIGFRDVQSPSVKHENKLKQNAIFLKAS